MNRKIIRRIILEEFIKRIDNTQILSESGALVRIASSAPLVARRALARAVQTPTNAGKLDWIDVKVIKKAVPLLTGPVAAGGAGGGGGAAAAGGAAAGGISSALALATAAAAGVVAYSFLEADSPTKVSRCFESKNNNLYKLMKPALDMVENAVILTDGEAKKYAKRFNDATLDYVAGIGAGTIGKALKSVGVGGGTDEDEVKEIIEDIGTKINLSRVSMVFMDVYGQNLWNVIEDEFGKLDFERDEYVNEPTLLLPFIELEGGIFLSEEEFLKELEKAKSEAEEDEEKGEERDSDVCIIDAFPGLEFIKKYDTWYVRREGSEAEVAIKKPNTIKYLNKECEKTSGEDDSADRETRGRRGPPDAPGGGDDAGGDGGGRGARRGSRITIKLNQTGKNFKGSGIGKTGFDERIVEAIKSQFSREALASGVSRMNLPIYFIMSSDNTEIDAVHIPLGDRLFKDFKIRRQQMESNLLSIAKTFYTPPKSGPYSSESKFDKRAMRPFKGRNAIEVTVNIPGGTY